MQNNLGLFVQKRALLNPTTEAVVDVASGRRQTYAELDERCNRVANGLTDTGLQTGKPIFIIQWQEGRRRLVYPDELARYELIYPFPAWESR